MLLNMHTFSLCLAYCIVQHIVYTHFDLLQYLYSIERQYKKRRLLVVCLVATYRLNRYVKCTGDL